MNHRQIWEQYYGPIGKDKHGRSLEVHHINGDHTDNRIENLMLVTIEEHYNIHKKQGDWVACHLIAQRMNISPEEKSRLISESNRKRIGKLNPFYGKKHTKETIKKMREKRAKQVITHTSETKNKISLALKGVKKSKEHIEKLSIAKQGMICKSFMWKIDYKGSQMIVRNLKKFCRDKKIEPFSTFNGGKEINGYRKVGRV